jgi:hypothetical protein
MSRKKRLQLSVRGLLLVTACSAVTVWIATRYFRDGYVDERLRSKISVRFNDAPFTHVLSVLSKDAGIRIMMDAQGLAKENVNHSTPVTLVLTQPISLKSTLILILEPMRLRYIKRGGGLVVTSESDIPFTKSSPYWCGTLGYLAEDDVETIY